MCDADAPAREPGDSHAAALQSSRLAFFARTNDGTSVAIL